MKITGKVTKVLEKITGTSTKGEWYKQTFIVQTQEEYNNIYPIDAFKKDVPNEGDDVTVDFNISANEWQGKYYTSLSLWKYETISQTPSNPTQSEEPKTNLPF